MLEQLELWVNGSMIGLLYGSCLGLANELSHSAAQSSLFLDHRAGMVAQFARQ